MYVNPIDILRDDELARRGLPEVAYIDTSWDASPDATKVSAVKRGESGYYPITTPLTADEMNAAHGVTKGQAEAMHIGSMMGWHAPGANPAMWTEDGRAKALA